jgi:hypothetical protein
MTTLCHSRLYMYPSQGLRIWPLGIEALLFMSSLQPSSIKWRHIRGLYNEKYSVHVAASPVDAAETGNSGLMSSFLPRSK